MKRFLVCVAVLVVLAIGIWLSREFYGRIGFGTGCMSFSYSGNRSHDSYYKEDFDFLIAHLTALGFHKCTAVEIPEERLHGIRLPDNPPISQLPIWCSMRYDLPDGSAQLLRLYFDSQAPGFLLVISGPSLVPMRIGRPLLKIAEDLRMTLRKEWYLKQKGREARH